MCTRETFPSSPRTLSHSFAHPHADVRAAHEHCRLAERHILDRLPGADPRAESELDASLVCTRVLGHLLEEENERMGVAQVNIAGDVLCAVMTVGDDERVEKVVELGRVIRDYFIRPFRHIDVDDSPSLSHPSPPPFDLTPDETLDFLLQPSTSPDGTRKQALVRDGFRDVLNRTMDRKYFLGKWERDHPGEKTVLEGVAALEGCYIFKAPLRAKGSRALKSAGDDAASTSGLLERFGYGHLVDELAGGGIHRLSNVLTLTHENRLSFDEMSLWLEETDVRHRYRIVTPDLTTAIRAQQRLPSTVDFTSHTTSTSASTSSNTPQEHTLPSPDALRLHALACRLSRLSGASAYFDRIQDFFDAYGCRSTFDVYGCRLTGAGTGTGTGVDERDVFVDA
ncbi:unnamed protein product, partial [Peniophora sp. CBMAI 1063]